jgi:hypothetical protein
MMKSFAVLMVAVLAAFTAPASYAYHRYHRAYVPPPPVYLVPERAVYVPTVRCYTRERPTGRYFYDRRGRLHEKVIVTTYCPREY